MMRLSGVSFSRIFRSFYLRLRFSSAKEERRFDRPFPTVPLLFGPSVFNPLNAGLRRDSLRALTRWRRLVERVVPNTLISKWLK